VASYSPPTTFCPVGRFKLWFPVLLLSAELLVQFWLCGVARSRSVEVVGVELT
jgi:phosphatidylglycerophosphate synthase